MNKIIKLSDWAKMMDIHYQTAHRKFKSGSIPDAFKDLSGKIFVNIEFDVCPFCNNKTKRD